MGYSKIKQVEVVNFMVYPHAKAVFDDTGILNIKGYNSSGKSVILLACAVAMMNIYPTKQAKYIRHDESYFRIIITFDDGVTIVRDKYKNGQSLYEMYKDDQLVFSTKVGDRLTKVDAVPEPISNYLSLINTDLGFLNYQVRRDPMWIVETKGSENYATMHEVLKTEEIARANAMLNSDINKLNSDIASIESEIAEKRNRLEGFSDVDERLQVLLYDRESKVQKILRMYDSLFDTWSIIEELDSIKDIPDIKPIDTSRLARISNISKLITALDDIKVAPDVKPIEAKRLAGITSIDKALSEISIMQDSFWSEPIEKIDVSKIAPLNTIGKYISALEQEASNLNKLKASKKNLSEEKQRLVQSAKDSGIKFVECENCGTLLEVDVKG